MSYLNSGLLSTYSSLTDKHLAGYFNNTRIRRHLQRVGLITRSGRIVPDKEYRLKLIRRDHQRHVRECLAQAIFHKVLDMERHHQIEIKRKLEDFSRKERVHKIKVERSKRYDEDVIPLLSPKPPSGPRNGHKQPSGPEGEQSDSSESLSSSRPNTAPGKMQRPYRLQPINRNSTTASVRQTSPGYRRRDSSDDTEQQFNCTDKDLRPVTMTEFSREISPYQLPIINNYITPVPPSTKRTLKGTPNGIMRGRRLRPTTAPSVPAIEKDSKFYKSSVHSNVSVTMVYYGKTVHLSHDDIDMRDEVKVFQQHCGGENVCIYKGRLMEGEAFQFVSRRHRGFPFSLTFFLNGLQVDRLSSCCEFKHRKGSRLGGKHGHFGFSSVDGASPCYKCIISLGLDKKPTPPKRTKEEIGKGIFPGNSQEMAEKAKEVEEEDIKQDSHSHLEAELRKEHVDDDSMETESRGIDKGKAKDDYDEDFEADDERADEDMEEAKPLAVDHSSSSDKRDSDKEVGEIVNHQMVDEEKYSDSEFEEDDKAEDNKSPYRSTSSSSREDSDSEAEELKEAVKKAEGRSENETGQLPEEQLQVLGGETTSAPAAENDQQGLEGQTEESDDCKNETSSPTHPQTTLTKGDTETNESHRDSTDTADMKLLDMHPQEGKEVGKSGAAVDSGDNAAKPEYSGDTEPERAKSVQEKLVEAIMKETQCSSEPELSDTTIEEEDLPTKNKTMEQRNNDEKEVETDTFPLQKPGMKEETLEDTENRKEQIDTKIKEDNMEEMKNSESSEAQTQESMDCALVQKVRNAEEDITKTNASKAEETGSEVEKIRGTDSSNIATEAEETVADIKNQEATDDPENEVKEGMEDTEAQAEETEKLKESSETQAEETEPQEDVTEEQEKEIEVQAETIEAQTEGTKSQGEKTEAQEKQAEEPAEDTEAQAEEAEAQEEGTEAQAEGTKEQEEGTEAQEKETEAQEKETEAQAEALEKETEAQAEGTEAQEKQAGEQAEETETQSGTEAQGKQAEEQAEETEAQAEGTEAQEEGTDAQEKETEAQAEGTEAREKETGAQEEGTEAQEKETEAQAERTEAQAEGTEAQSKETEAQEKQAGEQAEETETQSEGTEAQEKQAEKQAERTEALGKETEAQEEGTEAQSKETEAQEEGTEAQEKETEAQAEGTEAQEKETEAQAEGTEAQEKETEAQAEGTEAQSEEPEAQEKQAGELAEETETQAEGTETQAEETEEQAEGTEAKADMTEAQTEVTEAQTEDMDAQVNNTADRDESTTKTPDITKDDSESQDKGQDKLETQEEGSEKVEDELIAETPGKNVDLLLQETEKGEKNEIIDKTGETEAKRKDTELKEQNDTEYENKNNVKREDSETSQRTEEKLEENEAVGKDEDEAEADTDTECTEKYKEQGIVASAGNEGSTVQLNTEQEAKFDKTLVVKGNRAGNVITVDGENESITGVEDKQVSGEVEVRKTNAKDEEMEECLQMGIISAEGENKVEEASKEAMAKIDKGEKEPKSFETGSKIDMTAADVHSKAVEAVRGFEDVQSLIEEKGSKSNSPELQIDIKACKGIKTKTVAQELGNETRNRVTEEREGKKEDDEHEGMEMEPALPGERKLEEREKQKSEAHEQKLTVKEEESEVSVSVEKVTELTMEKLEDRIEEVKDDDREKKIFDTKEAGASGMLGLEDTEIQSNLMVKELAWDQKSIASNSDCNTDTNIVNSNIAEREKEESVAEMEHCKDDGDEKVYSEGLFNGTKERTETCEAAGETVVNTSADRDDTIVEDLVQEDKAEADEIKQEFAAEEITFGKVAEASTALKSKELLPEEKVMDLEDMPHIETGMKEINTEAEDDMVFSPETMVKEDEGDLVTSWVNKHQASRCFQTFVEPLDELNGFSSDEVKESEAAHTTELSKFECSEKRLHATEKNSEIDTPALVPEAPSKEIVFSYDENTKERVTSESDPRQENIEAKRDQKELILEQQNLKECITRSNVSEYEVPEQKQEEHTTAEEIMTLECITKSEDNCRLQIIAIGKNGEDIERPPYSKENDINSRERRDTEENAQMNEGQDPITDITNSTEYKRKGGTEGSIKLTVTRERLSMQLFPMEDPGLSTLTAHTETITANRE